MNSTYIQDTIGLVFLSIIVIAAATCYFANIWKLIKMMREQKYSIRFILRGVGVFFPVVGIIMGLV